MFLRNMLQALSPKLFTVGDYWSQVFYFLLVYYGSLKIPMPLDSQLNFLC